MCTWKTAAAVEPTTGPVGLREASGVHASRTIKLATTGAVGRLVYATSLLGKFMYDAPHTNSRGCAVLAEAVCLTASTLGLDVDRCRSPGEPPSLGQAPLSGLEKCLINARVSTKVNPEKVFDLSCDGAAVAAGRRMISKEAQTVDSRRALFRCQQEAHEYHDTLTQ